MFRRHLSVPFSVRCTRKRKRGGELLHTRPRPSAADEEKQKTRKRDKTDKKVLRRHHGTQTFRPTTIVSETPGHTPELLQAPQLGWFALHSRCVPGLVGC